MKLAIMQPYFFPYIGYFQLIQAVDAFVVYDNIQFTKKGWINRNRILVNGRDEYISLPIQSDSDYLDIRDRKLAPGFEKERGKILRRITESYRRSPQFSSVFPLVESVMQNPETNLFAFLYQSIQSICRFLNLETPFIVSSTLSIDHQLKAQEKVIAICRALHAGHYINTIGGMALYDKAAFAQQGINLEFIRSNPVEYPQFENKFVPGLSIIDVLMFNPVETTRQLIRNAYTLE